MADLPQPAPQPPPIPEPRDVDYPGVVRLSVDATDTARGIINVVQTLPVDGGRPLILLYPKWMPGYHAPQNPIGLFAGLEIRAGDRKLDWRRDPVEVHAFHVEPPEDAQTIEARFQFLSPTSEGQGDVVVSDEMALLHWGRMLLYPAGHFARRIQVEAAVTLPQGWTFATVLEPAGQDGAAVRFRPVGLDVLVDSPVMAGRFHEAVPLDDGKAVWLDLFAHDANHLAAGGEGVERHRALVRQADRLFASRHFDRYRFLTALSEELGGGGVEHHRCAEIIAPPDYFADWDRHLTKRDVAAHEFTHSWNGKFRRGADSWTPNFEKPIRNSLMWVYEGQTQYWGHVLTARARMWSIEHALEALAKVAATYDTRPGGRWRTLADTTRDPVINGREPIPWPSWQRSEDYYSEGQLLWLAADTLIRELTGEERSLDDFARAFFGVDDGRMTTRTYDLDEVVATLTEVADHDWRAFLDDKLESRRQGAPLEGLQRGGYNLVYRPERSDFCRRFDADAGQFDLRFSVGLNIGADGTIQEVVWDSPAFEAGLTAGALIEQVNGQDYGEQAIGDAIADGGMLDLAVRPRPQARVRSVSIVYQGGHRFPHLSPIAGARPRLRDILAPL
ncbi:MAG TPA: peptidase M61 [Caulobacter sp.]|nr:peptidase M61 [Caulobacter sp.]